MVQNFCKISHIFAISQVSLIKLKAIQIFKFHTLVLPLKNNGTVKISHFTRSKPVALRCHSSFLQGVGYFGNIIKGQKVGKI